MSPQPKRLSLFLLFLVPGILLSGTGHSRELQTWSDIRGREITAQLLGVDDSTNHLVMRKASGAQVRIPMQRLSIGSKFQALAGLAGLEEGNRHATRALSYLMIAFLGLIHVVWYPGFLITAGVMSKGGQGHSLAFAKLLGCQVFYLVVNGAFVAMDAGVTQVIGAVSNPGAQLSCVAASVGLLTLVAQVILLRNHYTISSARALLIYVVAPIVGGMIGGILVLLYAGIGMLVPMGESNLLNWSFEELILRPAGVL